MTTLQVPGVNISILRQQGSTPRGVPLLISGRVTGLGLPISATVRVSLEGPEFDPQVINFDTFASPLGDYSVPVRADKDGRYTVTAMAYPFVILPFSPPGLPSPIDILPPLAESPSPPIVVGDRQNGTVNIDGQRVGVPELSQFEINQPISVAPFIPITIGGIGGVAPFAFPAAPTGLAPDQPTPITIITTITPPPEGTAPTPAPAGVVSAQIVGFTIEG